MASWNEPALINKISDDVPAIKSLLLALLKMNDAGTEDVPAGAKRLYSVSGGVQFQNYTGSAWTNVGKLIHDVDMLDGKHASSAATADTIPVRDANGKLAGDVLGNANTATTASSVAAGYVVPVANGGTGASDEAGARTNLGTNNAANITTGVLAIARGGTGSGIQNFVDLSTAQTIGGNKTFSGEVLLNKNVLKMTVLDTLEGATDERTDTLIQGISPNADGGITALFGASGNAVFGAGEGKDSLLAELAGNADEDAYIIADGNIVFHPGADTYADRKTITLNATGELSGLAKVTATSFVGNVTGNCSGSSGSCTGNAATATKATQDGSGNVITSTYVNLTGAQTISGVKTFTGIPKIQTTGSAGMQMISTGFTKANTSQSAWLYIPFLDSSANDSTGRIGFIGGNYNKKATLVSMTAYRSSTATDTTNAQIGIGYDASGNLYTVAPTPATADNTTKIATTAFVKAQGYLTRLTNVSEIGRFLDFHYDNATAKYDYDVRICVNSQGDAAGRGCLDIAAGELRVTASTSNQLRLVNGNYGVIFRNDGSNFYLLQTASGSATDSWNSARPLTVNLSNGVCSISGNAATATKLGTANKGAKAQPIYLAAGVPTAGIKFTNGTGNPSGGADGDVHFKY